MFSSLKKFSPFPQTQAPSSATAGQEARPQGALPTASQETAAAAGSGTASIHDPVQARSSRHRFKKVLNTNPFKNLGRKGSRSGQGEASEQGAQATDSAPAAQDSALAEKRGKWAKEKVRNVFNKATEPKNKTQRPTISEPRDARLITGDKATGWNAPKKTVASANGVRINGRRVQPDDISGPQRVSPNLQELTSAPGADDDWNRYRKLTEQLESLKGQSNRTDEQASAKRLTLAKMMPRRQTPVSAPATAKEPQSAQTKVAMAQEHAALGRQIATRYEVSSQKGTLNRALELQRQLLNLPDEYKPSLLAAVRRYATKTARHEIEDILLGGKILPTGNTMEELAIAAERMMDEVDYAKDFSGIVSKDAVYWLKGSLLVRSQNTGELSFPLPAYSVTGINMSPDQRIHAICTGKNEASKVLITLRTDGTPEESVPLPLPSSTYMFAVADNNTVAVAARDDDQSPVLMILNGYDRKNGSTEFSEIRIRHEKDENSSGATGSAQDTESNERQGGSSPVNSQIHSMVFMREGHIAMLDAHGAVWRIEQQIGDDPSKPVEYECIRAVPLLKDEQRHIGRKLVKPGRPAPRPPRPAPVPERLVITPGGTLGGFESDGTPLVMNLQREWERQELGHDKATPVTTYFNKFASDSIPAGGLSVWGWPASSDYLSELRNAQNRGLGYGMRKVVFPWTLRAVANESLIARQKDYQLSHHAFFVPSAHRAFREALKAGHRDFYGAIEQRLEFERKFLTEFINRPERLPVGGHDSAFTRDAATAIGAVLELIIGNLPEKPAQEEDQQSRYARFRGALAKKKEKSPAELAAHDQKLRYKNYHKSEDKVRSSQNVLHVVHEVLAPILGENHELVARTAALVNDNVFLGFEPGEGRAFYSLALNTKQDHYNEFSVASSLLVSYVWELLTAELKAAKQAAGQPPAEQGSTGSNAHAADEGRAAFPLLDTLEQNLADYGVEAFKAAARQHMNEEKSALFNDRVDALVTLKNNNVLDITALDAFASAQNHFSAAIKQPHHKAKRALRGQGVLGTHEIAKAYETLLAHLPEGSSITVSSRRAGGIDLEGMSVFVNLLAKKAVHAATSGTVQVFAIEPVIQLNTGREYAMTFTKLANGVGVTFGKLRDLTFTPLAFKAQFGFGISQLDSVEKDDVIWAYTGINIKWKDTQTRWYKHAVSVAYTDQKVRSGLQMGVKTLAGEIHPAEMLSHAESISATVDRGVTTVLSLDIEPLLAAGVVSDLVTSTFARQGKALIAAVQQLNLLWRTEDALAFSANIDGKSYVFKHVKRFDMTNTEILVSEFQGVPVGNGIGLDGSQINNGNEYGQQKVQPGIYVRTRHIAGTPVTNGGITMRFNPQDELDGMATSYTYQANFADQKFQELKKAAFRRDAASLEDYIPVLKNVLENASEADRPRLEKLFRELTKLPRDATVSVHVQYRPSFIEELRKEFPVTKSNPFFAKEDGKIDIDVLLKLATNHPDNIQVSQIVINEQRIYVTGSSDGVSLLRTQSEAKLQLHTSSTISFLYKAADTSELASFATDGSYFTEKRTPTKGLLPKLGAILGNVKLENDREVLAFLKSPYDLNSPPPVERVRLIQQSMRELNKSQFKNPSDLASVIASRLSSEQKDAMLAVFPKGFMINTSGLPDSDELDTDLIFKVLSTPEYFEHFENTNLQLLGEPAVTVVPATTVRSGSDDGRPDLPTISIIDTQPTPMIGLGAILPASTVASPVVQKTVSTKSAGYGGSFGSGSDLAQPGLTLLSRVHYPLDSLEHLTPITPGGAGTLHTAPSNRSLSAARPMRASDRGTLNTSSERRKITRFTVSSSALMGWPATTGREYLSIEEIADDFRSYLGEQNDDQGGNSELLGELQTLSLSSDVNPVTLLSKAGALVDKLTYEERVVERADNAMSSESGSPERRSADEQGDDASMRTGDRVRLQSEV